MAAVTAPFLALLAAPILSIFGFSVAPQLSDDDKRNLVGLTSIAVIVDGIDEVARSCNLRQLSLIRSREHFPKEG